MYSTIVFTSANSKSSLEEIFTRIPFAPDKSTSSNNGLATASIAARSARPSPSARPVPIIARPISDITRFTSAKSTLTKPSFVIMSVIPSTALRNTLSATLKASLNLIFLGRTFNNFSF